MLIHLEWEPVEKLIIRYLILPKKFILLLYQTKILFDTATSHKIGLLPIKLVYFP